MKTYCISDIHGHYENLLRFINSLKEDDRVFVLGDVVDKGSEPIACLQTIMNDKRFTMLLGNHEYMMFQYLSSIDGTYDRELAEEQWVFYNSGNDTLAQYNQLEDKEKRELFNFIVNLPLNVPDLVVGDRHFYLVHSNPVSYSQVTMADLKNDERDIAEYVWERRMVADKLDIKDRTVIAGHTPVQFYSYDFKSEIQPMADVKRLPDADYIDIDGGLAASVDNSRLIALCLDDLSYKLY